MTSATVTLRITANSQGLQAEIVKAKQALGTLGESANGAAVSLDRPMTSASRGLASISTQLQRLQALGIAWAALSGVRAFARDVIQAADAMTGLQSRLRLVTKGAQEYAQAFDSVQDIAERARGGLEATATLYTRLAQASESLGLSQQRVANITEAVSSAVALSGGSAASAAAGVQQLAQAFSSGVLSGDEFRSVMENSPRVVKALTDALGVSVGELRKLAEQQLLTADIVAKALESQLDTMRRELSSMPQTVGQSIQQLENAWMLYVGAVNEASGATNGIAQSLHGIAGILRDATDEASSGSDMMSGFGQVLGIVAGVLLTVKNVIEAVVVGFANLVDKVIAAGEALGGTATSIGYSIKSIALASAGQFSAAREAAATGSKALADAWESANNRVTRANMGMQSSLDASIADIRNGFARLNGEATTVAEAQERAVDSVKRSIEVMSKSADPAVRKLAETIRNSTGSFIDWGNAAGDAGGQLEALRAKVRALLAGGDPVAALTAGIAGIEQKFATFGKSAADVARAQLAAAQASAAWNQLLPEQRAALEASAQAAIGHAATMDAQTAATRKVRDEAAEFITSTQERVAALQREVDTYGQTEGAVILYDAAMKGLTGARLADAQSAATQADALALQKKALDEKAAAANEAKAALESLQGIGESQAETLAELRDRLSGANAAQITYNKTMRDARAAFNAAGGAANKAAVEALNAAQKTAQGVKEMAEVLDADAIVQEVNTTPYDGMLDQLETLQEAIKLVGDETSEAFDPDKLKGYEEAQDRINQQMRDRNLALLQQGVSSLQTFAKEGTAAYTALGIAQDILAYKSAIAAIANQGSGDPYTAFARIAAMIAMMASIGIRVAGHAGGFTDTAAQRQATQGTGTVLGDSEAKSESIANAVEITADATSELVGINRGMLRALEALQDGLGGAATQLARGAGEVDFGKFDPGFMLNSGNGAAMGAAIGTAVMPVIGTIVGAVLGAVLGSVLGGSSRLTDQGIAISGGSLDEAQFSAYQEHQVRSWRFGSRRTIEQTAALPDDVANQFQLVMDSIVDTVREGALALGILPEEIQAAIDAYRIEEIRISLKDLSAEEQQKELEAVFSQIFDGLAGSVVPFIEQFQQVGEGLGETLVRVATGVQVTQEAMRQLGLVIETTDPETFAQISEGIIAAVGGLDEYISGIQNFASNFASESQQFASASAALTSAFAQVGLVVPDTRAAMFALMQTLDATTAEGQEQIATLLRLADVAGAYYDALEEQVKEAAEYLTQIGLGSLVESSFASRLAEIRASEQEAIDAANTLAVAHGREGASAIQLAAIRRWTLAQEAAAIRQLQAETQDLIARLYGGMAGTLDGINAQISELEGSMGSGLDGVREAGENLFDAWLQGIQTINDYLDSMLFGDLSALSPEEQLAEAQRQLLAAQQAAMAGDIDALNNLPQLAEQYLQLLQGTLGSGADYNTGFDWVRGLLQEVTGLQNPYTQQQNTVELVPSAELEALYARRDELMAEQEMLNRRNLAQQLAQNLHDLAVMLNAPILDMIALQGVSLEQLAIDLGVNLQDLTASSVEALGNMAATLGIGLGELTATLGLNLTDLAGGVGELAAQVGINLSALTVESTQTLALLATSLGADLSELATSLNLDLGSLADAQSLMNQALAAEIASLPAEQAATLAPLLEAISAATTEADAGAALQALNDAVNLLAPDIRTQLAPYLADVFPADALSDLDYLADIQAIAADQLNVLGLIRDNLRASNSAAGVPSYAVGTGYVPNTGLALIHQGEMIIPAPVADFHRRAGLPFGGASNDAVVAEVRALRDEVASLRRENSAGQDRIATTVKEGDTGARIQREDIARRDSDGRRSRVA